MRTLIELLDTAVAKYGDRPAFGIRGDDGRTETWTYREVDRRSKLAAFRLRALGLEPGDRILTWAPSTPNLPAVYYGAMRARVVFVPLDLRMSAEAIEGIVRKCGAKRLIIGTGRDAPDPRVAGLERFPTTTVEELTAPPESGMPAPAPAALQLERRPRRLRRRGLAHGGDGTGPASPATVQLPPDWEAQVAGWPQPVPEDLFELIFTSGTTGTPKGVMLAHDNIVASIESFYRIIPVLEHRMVSLAPLSHLFEQIVCVYYGMSVGASVLYPGSLNPRIMFEAMREHRVTTMVVVPQALDLFWSAIEREVAKSGRTAQFERLRGIARRLPLALRRLIFRSVHQRLGGGLRLFISAGAFLPPALQQAWEDLGVIVLQGYGATETGTGACTTLEDHGLGTVGRPPEGVQMRIVEDGEIQFRGPMLYKGYWDEPELTAAAFTEDGWYKSGDIGHFDAEGRLILSGRKKDMIVLPNGLNVYPEDIENALRVAGIRDSVVLETRPGRIEAVVLAPGVHGIPRAGEALPFDPAMPPDEIRATLDAAVKAANARLGPQQRIAGWRLWPEADFPRTHTLKIKRDRIRAWASVETPVVVRTG